MLIVSTWLQHRFHLPVKHGLHFPFLVVILNFLTLPFSIHAPPIISFRFLFFLKAIIGCSWKNSRISLLVWRMFQILRVTAVRFGKNRLCVNINGMRFGSCCPQFFLVVDRLLQAYQHFLIAHQQVCRKLASKIILG